jgi:hypothetical protein
VPVVGLGSDVTPSPSGSTAWVASVTMVSERSTQLFTYSVPLWCPATTPVGTLTPPAPRMETCSKVASRPSAMGPRAMAVL